MKSLFLPRLNVLTVCSLPPMQVQTWGFSFTSTACANLQLQFYSHTYLLYKSSQDIAVRTSCNFSSRPHLLSNLLQKDPPAAALKNLSPQ